MRQMKVGDRVRARKEGTTTGSYGIEGTVVNIEPGLFSTFVAGIDWDRGFGPNGFDNPDQWTLNLDNWFSYFEITESEPAADWSELELQ